MNNKNKEELVNGHWVEILSILPGEVREIPVGLLTIRPDMGCNDENNVLILDLAQCVRIRDELSQLLDDPASHLYMPPEQQEALRLD